MGEIVVRLTGADFLWWGWGLGNGIMRGRVGSEPRSSQTPNASHPHGAVDDMRAYTHQHQNAQQADRRGTGARTDKKI